MRWNAFCFSKDLICVIIHTVLMFLGGTYIVSDRRGKQHISRILIRSNWKHTRNAIFVLAVLFVLLFAVGMNF